MGAPRNPGRAADEIGEPLPPRELAEVLVGRQVNTVLALRGPGCRDRRFPAGRHGSTLRRGPPRRAATASPGMFSSASSVDAREKLTAYAYQE